ncbi:Nitrilase [Aphelenchoides besseyi]|nr:Nitrilase [Aphelenchoides besseyi]KAI6201303.1 Nitrilase [Aphelenchoides besseyi]
MFKVAIVQSGSAVYDTPACIQKLRHYAKRAESEGAKLVLFPEAFVGGYPKGLDFGLKLGIRSDEGRREFQRYFNSAITYEGHEANQIAEIAAETKLYIVVGVIEKSGGTLYCSVFYYGPNGERIGKHRKIMPTALERCVWGQGDGSTIEVFSTELGKISAAICWESYNPLLRTHMYQNGIQLYLAPTVDDRDVWLSSMRMIALEGRCFVISACQFLTNKDYPSDHPTHEKEESVLIRGGSLAIDPMGKILVQPVFDTETFHVVDIDLNACIRGKFDLDTVGHYARNDIFKLTVNTTPNQ